MLHVGRDGLRQPAEPRPPEALQRPADLGHPVGVDPVEALAAVDADPYQAGVNRRGVER